jgi:hypothetical protein
VNSETAIRNGGLAGNPLFFGSSTAETISTATNTGSWNGDHAYSVHSTESWATPGGGTSNNGSAAGIFNSENLNGSAFNTRSHRTILSGY